MRHIQILAPSFFSHHRSVYFMYIYRLPRWNKALDWSPWNCICLTETEATAHLKVVHIDQVYDMHLLNYIHNKHELAKKVFENLKLIDMDFVESGQWCNVGIAQKIV